MWYGYQVHLEFGNLFLGPNLLDSIWTPCSKATFPHCKPHEEMQSARANSVFLLYSSEASLNEPWN